MADTDLHSLSAAQRRVLLDIEPGYWFNRLAFPAWRGYRFSFNEALAVLIARGLVKTRTTWFWRDREFALSSKGVLLRDQLRRQS